MMSGIVQTSCGALFPLWSLQKNKFMGLFYFERRNWFEKLKKSMLNRDKNRIIIIMIIIT